MILWNVRNRKLRLKKSASLFYWCEPFCYLCSELRICFRFFHFGVVFLQKVRKWSSIFKFHFKCIVGNKEHILSAEFPEFSAVRMCDKSHQQPVFHTVCTCRKIRCYLPRSACRGSIYRKLLLCRFSGVKSDEKPLSRSCQCNVEKSHFLTYGITRIPYVYKLKRQRCVAPELASFLESESCTAVKTHLYLLQTVRLVERCLSLAQKYKRIFQTLGFMDGPDGNNILRCGSRLTRFEITLHFKCAVDVSDKSAQSLVRSLLICSGIFKQRTKVGTLFIAVLQHVHKRYEIRSFVYVLNKLHKASWSRKHS